MAAELSLNTDDGPDGAPRVTATGEIDLSNVAQLIQALNTASAGTRRPITIDLSTVRYLDSAGINVLFNHADKVDGLHIIVHPLLIRSSPSAVWIRSLPSTLHRPSRETTRSSRIALSCRDYRLYLCGRKQ
ncbi:STAS domain-containing protein [Mycobacterium montefiorense]|uniref:STAS domain-containing protein n=1 Tax=Mycobacterium montefiorense TaxID=154654 RepID=UPI0021F2AE7A|nr:STAS domain-containing protein [Mycobacterium montefiorense]